MAPPPPPRARLAPAPSLPCTDLTGPQLLLSGVWSARLCPGQVCCVHAVLGAGGRHHRTRTCGAPGWPSATELLRGSPDTGESRMGAWLRVAMGPRTLNPGGSLPAHTPRARPSASAEEGVCLWQQPESRSCILGLFPKSNQRSSDSKKTHCMHPTWSLLRIHIFGACTVFQLGVQQYA